MSAQTLRLAGIGAAALLTAVLMAADIVSRIRSRSYL